MVNKYRSEEELHAVEQQLEDLPVVGRLPYDETIAAADLEGTCPYRGTEEQKRLARELLEAVGAGA